MTAQLHSTDCQDVVTRILNMIGSTERGNCELHDELGKDRWRSQETSHRV